MTEKELKKLNRYQLLELLMMQTQRVKELEEKLAQLEADHVLLSNLGSMAEVSAKLSGLLDAAQKTADLYIEAAQAKAARIEENARELAQTYLDMARQGQPQEE